MTKGIKLMPKTEEIGEWFSDLAVKAELIEYTNVSGCYILRPRLYAMWEKVMEFLDNLFKKDGVRNASFPLLIPESNLAKEKEHVEGFSPEVAWVTHSGDEKLPERLAIRPTSETIMYPAYAKWIRSYKDLPLRLNQWCNVLRWEFKHPVPLLRSREFLWQEGHSAFATKEEADEEALKILGFYKMCYEELLACPCIDGRKTDSEKFAGADYSLSLEIFLPSGKAAQACTSHHLGQNFSKAFGIKFTDKDEKEKYVWQNSWGYTTRSLGIMIMLHADEKGLVIPPRVAPEKIVITPIIFDESKDKVLKKCEEIKKELSVYNAFVDERIDKTPGYKFNEWELKGIPLRIEIGPKDLENEQVIVVRRDTGKKESVPFKDLRKYVENTLDKMQREMFNKAKKFLDENIVDVPDMNKFSDAIKNKKMARAFWCGSEKCEEDIKIKTGATSRNIPFKQPSKMENCVVCGKKARYQLYFAKTY